MARVDLIGVSKHWDDVVAVEPTDLTIADGEFVAVLGPSGCGKSTTLFLLAGLYAPSGGDILFDGQRVNAVEAKDRNVGIVFQSYALYPHMTVRENIAFPLRFKGLKKDAVQDRVAEAAALVHVGDLLERRPSQLSGGQQQRVALARALVKEPHLLLLDEPLSNLDATLRLTMRAEIRALQRRLGITTLLVTHDQLEATTMADRVICMSRGRVEQIGTPDDLYDRPASLFVAGFIGAPPMNHLAGDADGTALRVGTVSLTLTARRTGSTVLGVRPEAIRLSAPDGGGTHPAAVSAVEPMGREVLYILDSPLGAVRVLETGSHARFAAGDRAGLAFDPSDVLLFDGGTGRRLEDISLAGVA